MYSLKKLFVIFKLRVIYKMYYVCGRFLDRNKMQLGGTVITTAIKMVGQHGGFHKSGDAPMYF